MRTYMLCYAMLCGGEGSCAVSGVNEDLGVVGDGIAGCSSVRIVSRSIGLSLSVQGEKMRRVFSVRQR